MFQYFYIILLIYSDSYISLMDLLINFRYVLVGPKKVFIQISAVFPNPSVEMYSRQIKA